jgi:hypothetical protein
VLTLLIGILLILRILSTAEAGTCASTNISTVIDEPTNGCQGFQPDSEGISGDDFLIPPPESWPLRLVIGTNNAVIFNGELFSQGSQIVFDYDAPRKALTFNGMDFMIDAPPPARRPPAEPPLPRRHGVLPYDKEYCSTTPEHLNKKLNEPWWRWVLT